MIIPALGAGLAGALVGGYYAPQLARYAALVPLKRKLVRSRSLVLSYDDGPGAELTPKLLDLMDSHKVKGTFFVLGMRAAANPQVVDRMVRDGHEVGCHGNKHVHAWKAAPWRVLADVGAGYRAISAWAPGNAPYRPPYGRLALPNWLAACRRGCRLGWWTADSYDTRSKRSTVEEAAARMVTPAGAVVLMHDFWADREHMDYVLRLTELVIHQAKGHGLTVRRLCDVQDHAE